MARVVIVGANHINTLGLIRSIGAMGRLPDAILEPCDIRFCNLRFSRYLKHLIIASPIVRGNS